MKGLREEWGNNVQIALGTGLIGGGLLGFLASAATLALNPVLLRSAGDVVHLVLGLQLVYSVLCLSIGLVGVLIKSGIFLFSGRPISDTKTAAVVTWVVFFLLSGLYALAWCRWLKIGGMSPEQAFRVRDLPVVLLVAAVSALLASLLSYAFYLLIVFVKKPERRRPHDLRRAFLVLLYMGSAFVLFVVVLRLAAHPEEIKSGLTRELINPGGRRLCLLGIDGMDGNDLTRLGEQKLTPWAEAMSSGCTGGITLPADPIPPMLWTLVATGRDLAAHGIVDYQTQVVKGLSTPLRIGPNQVGLFDLFHTVLPFFHMTRTVPVKSYMRESKGLWNMASDAGKRTLVVNWWVSWPAERVRGAVVSDHAWLKLAGDDPYARSGLSGAAADGSSAAETSARAAATVQTPEDGTGGAMSPIRPDGRPLFLERETWPNTLLIELSPWAASALSDTLARTYGPLPDSTALAVFTSLGIPSDVLRSDLFYAHSAAYLLNRQKADLSMLHLPGPDIIRRVLLKSGMPSARLETARREALIAYWKTLGPAVSAYLRQAQAQGDLLCGVVLPGIPWANSGDANANGKDGQFLLSGPGVRTTRLQSPVQLAEIAPTLLWLLGLPASREMDGAPRLDCAGGELAAALSPLRWIPSYGRQEALGLEEAASTLDQEMLERFRSLGYLR